MMPAAPKHEDIAALERERAGYEARGNAERVKQVTAQINRIRSSGKERAVSPAPERA